MFDFLISAAYAQGTTKCPTGYTCLTNPVGTTSVTVFIGRIINAGLGILGSLALLAFFYGGFLWLTSAGDSKKVSEGTEVMKWSIIGLVIIFGAVGLTQLVFKVVTGS
jgi:hypothetical protein